MRRECHGPRVRSSEPPPRQLPSRGTQGRAGIAQGRRLRRRRTARDPRAVSGRAATEWSAVCRSRVPRRARGRRPSARNERFAHRSGARQDPRCRQSNAIPWPLRARLPAAADVSGADLGAQPNLEETIGRSLSVCACGSRKIGDPARLVCAISVCTGSGTWQRLSASTSASDLTRVPPPWRASGLRSQSQANSNRPCPPTRRRKER
jgi:hypothetical protein